MVSVIIPVWCLAELNLCWAMYDAMGNFPFPLFLFSQPLASPPHAVAPAQPSAAAQHHFLPSSSLPLVSSQVACASTPSLIAAVAAGEAARAAFLAQTTLQLAVVADGASRTAAARAKAAADAAMASSLQSASPPPAVPHCPAPSGPALAQSQLTSTPFVPPHQVLSSCIYQTCQHHQQPLLRHCLLCHV